jgi:hypothetical protein
MSGIQQNFMGTFNIKTGCAYRRLVSVRHLNSKLWPLISYSVCFRKKIVSALLLCNYWLEFNKTLWEPSIPSEDAHFIALMGSDILTQSYGPWLFMQYAYRKIFVSVLLPCYYWLEFNETLLEPSIPRGDAHIVTLFGSDILTLSYGPS